MFIIIFLHRFLFFCLEKLSRIEHVFLFWFWNGQYKWKFIEITNSQSVFLKLFKDMISGLSQLKKIANWWNLIIILKTFNQKWKIAWMYSGTSDQHPRKFILCNSFPVCLKRGLNLRKHFPIVLSSFLLLYFQYNATVEGIGLSFICIHLSSGFSFTMKLKNEIWKGSIFNTLKWN